jgi:hypothetical protein
LNYRNAVPIGIVTARIIERRPRNIDLLKNLALVLELVMISDLGRHGPPPLSVRTNHVEMRIKWTLFHHAGKSGYYGVLRCDAMELR